MAASPKVFEPIPEREAQEAAPKRTRRPRGTAEQAPRRRRGASLELRIGAFLTRVNIPLHIVAAIMPTVVHADDPLSPTEIVALSKALTVQAQAHATFRRYLELAIATSDSADLVLVIAAIGVRRAANHGLVPGPIGQIASAALADPAALAAMFSSGAEEAPVEETPAEPVDIGAGGMTFEFGPKEVQSGYHE